MRFFALKWAYALAILLVIGYGVYAFRGPQGIPALMKKREEIRLLEKSNGEMAKEIEARRNKIHRLSENPAEQELEIRRQMKLVRPGEKVFILQDEKKPAR
jgi:cell division protein FtsB